MRENLKQDIRALVRIIALHMVQNEKIAEGLVDWAYERTKDGMENPSDIVNRFLSTDKPATAPLKKEFIRRFIDNREPFPVEAVKSIILHMPYNEFLKTPYWKAISQYVKERDFCRCTKCGNQKRLQVHHITYSHHGDELHNLRDLTTLCRNCHKETHEATRLHKTTQDD